MVPEGERMGSKKSCRPKSIFSGELGLSFGSGAREGRGANAISGGNGGSCGTAMPPRTHRMANPILMARKRSRSATSSWHSTLTHIMRTLLLPLLIGMFLILPAHADIAEPPPIYVEGYASQSSYAPGDEAVFHISTGAPVFAAVI